MHNVVRTIGDVMIALSVLFASAGLAAAETVSSPDGRLAVDVDVTATGEPYYKVSYDGREDLGAAVG